MDEIKQNLLYLMLFITFALSLYFPLQRIALFALPCFAAWLVWKSLRLWPYSLLLVVLFMFCVFSREIEGYSFKTIKRPGWTLVGRVYFSAIVTVFYGSWFFSLSAPYFLIGSNNVKKRYLLLVLCFVCVFILTDIFIFYLLAPAMTKKTVEQRGRLTNYGGVFCFKKTGKNCLAEKLRLADVGTGTKAAAMGRLHKPRRQQKRKIFSKKMPKFQLPFVEGYGIKFANSDRVFILAPSQIKAYRHKVGVVYSYERCTTVFGLEYIKNIKELGSAKSGKPSRWDVFSYA